MPFQQKIPEKYTQFLFDCAMKERRWSYIFRWHNFLELVQSELLLALPHILPEHLLQPGDVLLVENPFLPARREEIMMQYGNLLQDLQRVRYHNNKGHELLHRGVVVAVLVNATHQLRHHASTGPNLRWKSIFF